MTAPQAVLRSRLDTWTALEANEPGPTCALQCAWCAGDVMLALALTDDDTDDRLVEVSRAALLRSTRHEGFAAARGDDRECAATAVPWMLMFLPVGIVWLESAIKAYSSDQLEDDPDLPLQAAAQVWPRDKARACHFAGVAGAAVLRGGRSWARWPWELAADLPFAWHLILSYRDRLSAAGLWPLPPIEVARRDARAIVDGLVATPASMTKVGVLHGVEGRYPIGGVAHLARLRRAGVAFVTPDQLSDDVIDDLGQLVDYAPQSARRGPGSMDFADAVGLLARAGTEAAADTLVGVVLRYGGLIGADAVRACAMARQALVAMGAVAEPAIASGVRYGRSKDACVLLAKCFTDDSDPAIALPALIALCEALEWGGAREFVVHTIASLPAHELARDYLDYLDSLPVPRAHRRALRDARRRLT